MARKPTKHEKIPDLEPKDINPPTPFLSPLNRIDSKYIQDSSIRNPSVKEKSRAFFAIVGPEGSTGVDFIDIQEAINAARDAGGGAILLKVGTYYPKHFITLYDNISLIGEDPDKTTIDGTGMGLSANQASIFAGGEEVTNSGAISTTNGSTTIGGAGTSFISTGVKEGDTIYINAHPYSIRSIESETSLTIKEVYRGIAVSADIYAILRPKKNISLENFTLISNRSGTNNGGILFTWCEKVRCERIRVSNFSGLGFTAESSFNFTFTECEASNCLTGFEVHDEASGDRITNGEIINCYSWGNSSRGYMLDGVSIVRLTDSTANGNNVGIKVAGDEIVVSGCHSEFNVLYGIMIDTSIYNRVIGNNCSSNQYGIILTGANQDNTIVGNICELNSNDGINVDNGEGNTITGNQCVANEDYGIALAANATETYLSGNYLSGNTSGKVSDSGTNTVRAVRYVPIVGRTQLYLDNPADTNWSTISVNSETSSDCFAVNLSFVIDASTAGRVAYVRKTDSGDGQNIQNSVAENSVAAIPNIASSMVEVNSTQQFDWSVNNADVSAFFIGILGYWEYIN